MGGIEDQLSAPIVLLELDHGRVGVVALEVEDVAKVGAPPGIDRLVVVANDAQVAVPLGKRAHPQVLGPIGVLILVNVEVPPAILVARQDLRRPFEQVNGLQQKVVEVERIGGLQSFPIATRQPGNDALVVIEQPFVGGAQVDQIILGAADRAEHGSRAVLAGGRQVLLAQDLLHQRLLVVRVVDDEAPIDPDRLAVATQDTRADRVEGPRLHVPARLADERQDSLTKFGGSLVGERHGQDLPRPDALDPDQVRDPMGQHARLAAARPGEDEKGALGRRDGLGLGSIQIGQNSGRQSLRRGHPPVRGGLGRRPVAEVRRGRRLLIEGRLCSQPPVRLELERLAREFVLVRFGKLPAAGTPGPPGRRGIHRRIVGRRALQMISRPGSVRRPADRSVAVRGQRIWSALGASIETGASKFDSSTVITRLPWSPPLTAIVSLTGRKSLFWVYRSRVPSPLTPVVGVPIALRSALVTFTWT